MIGSEKLEKQVGIPVKDRSIVIPVIIIVINSPGTIVWLQIAKINSINSQNRFGGRKRFLLVERNSVTFYFCINCLHKWTEFEYLFKKIKFIFQNKQKT